MRILILLLIVYGLAILPAYCEEVAPKVYAEPLYRWVDPKGVEHVDVKSKVPADLFKPPKKHGKFVGFCIGVREFTKYWITPILQTAGGVRSILN